MNRIRYDYKIGSLKVTNVRKIRENRFRRGLGVLREYDEIFKNMGEIIVIGKSRRRGNREKKQWTEVIKDDMRRHVE